MQNISQIDTRIVAGTFLVSFGDNYPLGIIAHGEPDGRVTLISSCEHGRAIDVRLFDPVIEVGTVMGGWGNSLVHNIQEINLPAGDTDQQVSLLQGVVEQHTPTPLRS